jgi:hypothetical protein
MAQAFPAIIVPPQIIAMQNQSRYVVAYDFSSRSIRLPPPDGWGRSRSFLYSRVTDHFQLNAFAPDQYSLWALNNTNPDAVYTAMIDMTRDHDLPIGMVPTTIKGLMMSHQPNQNLMDVTNAIRLGGGHTPANPIGAIIPSQLIPPQHAALYGPSNAVPARHGRLAAPGQAGDYSAPL